MQVNMTCLIVATSELFAVGLRAALGDSIRHKLGPEGRIKIIMNDARYKLSQMVKSDQSVAVTIYETDVLDSADKISLDHIRATLPRSRILVAASYASYDQGSSSYASNVDGLIQKSRPAQTFVDVVEDVLDGRACTRDLDDTPGEDGIVRSPETVDVGENILPDALRRRLSPRQQTVLTALAQGMSNKQIARELKLSEATIKVHVNAVFRVLNVHNRASAVARVFQCDSDATQESISVAHGRESNHDPTRTRF